MATSIIGTQQRAYGIGQGLQPIPPFTIVAQRAPTTSDRANIGTFWIYTVSNDCYVLTSINNGISNWVSFNQGGTGQFSSLVITTGPNTIAGLTTFNGNVVFNGNIASNITQTAGVTSLLQTTITGSLSQDGGATLLNTDAGNQTVRIGDGAGIKTVTLGSTNTTSVTNINSGSGKTNFNGTIPGNPGRLNIVENGAGYVIMTSSNNAANTFHLFTQQLSNDDFAPVWSSYKDRAGATVQSNDLLFQQRVGARGTGGQADSVIMEYQTVGVLPATSIVPVQYTLKTGNSAGQLTTKMTITPNGELQINSAGQTLAVKGGNPTDFIGQATLGSGGTPGLVQVNNANITANDKIFLTVSAAAGTQGFLSYTIGAGNFTITSTDVADTSTVSYFIVRQI